MQTNMVRQRLFLFLVVALSVAANELGTESTAANGDTTGTLDTSTAKEAVTPTNTEVTTPTSGGSKDWPVDPDYFLKKAEEMGFNWYGPVNWFVSVITPKTLPLKSFKKLLDSVTGSSAGTADEVGPDDSVTKETTQGESKKKPTLDVIKDEGLEILKEEAGMMVFIIFGLVMALLMPLCGLVSMCCLCCSSKKVARPSKKSQRSKTRLAIALGLLLLVILVGIVYMFAAGGVLNQAFDNSRQKLINSISDANILVNNTKHQVEYIVGDAFSKTFQGIEKDLNDIDVNYGKPIINKIEEKGLLTDLTRSLDEPIKTLRVISYLVNDTMSLIDDIKNFQSQIVNLTTPCPIPDCSGLLIDPPDQDILNEKTMKNLNQSQDQLIQAQFELRNIVDSFPEKVKNETETTRGTIVETMKEFQDSMQKMIKPFSDISDSVNNGTDSMKSSVDKIYKGEIKIYVSDNLYYSTLGLTCLVFVTWFLFLMGLCGGGMFYQKGKIPDDRSCASSCSGCLLLLGITSVFLFSFLFWLLCTVLFALGGHVDAYICKPLYDEPKFTAISEYISMADKDKSGSVLGKFILGNSSIKLDLADVLNSCKANKTVYDAFRLKNLKEIDLDKIFDYRTELKLDEKLKELEGRVNLEEMILDSESLQQNSTFDGLDDLTSKLNFTTVFPDSTKFKETLAQLKNFAADQTAEDKIDGIGKQYDDLEKRINKVNVSLITETLETLKTELGEVNRTVTEAVKSAEPIIKSQTVIYVDRILLHVDNYVNLTNSSLHNTIGQCGPVWNMFTAIRAAVCQDVIYPINGYWFGFGWALFFFLPTLLVAVKLSRHLRRMKCKDTIAYQTPYQQPQAQYR